MYTLGACYSLILMVMQTTSSCESKFLLHNIFHMFFKTLLHLLSLGVIRPCSKEQVTSGEVQVGDGCGFRVVCP